MRDFRDAKVMARTLRVALAAKGHKLTNSESLELVAEAFGAADWNSLIAAIRATTTVSNRKTSFATDPDSTPRYSADLEATLHRALGHANQRNHEYATLEHLVLALIDDAGASAVMKACQADLVELKTNLTAYIDDDLKGLKVDSGVESRPTAAFLRVTQRAAINARKVGRQVVTGADILVAIFPERESYAVHSLQQQGVTS
jgi:hypothetical protein